jgi:hypothetical protein
VVSLICRGGVPPWAAGFICKLSGAYDQSIILSAGFFEIENFGSEAFLGVIRVADHHNTPVNLPVIPRSWRGYLTDKIFSGEKMEITDFSH